MALAHDIEPPKTNIGSAIREAREARRMTQVELADAAGVSSRSIGSYERGAVEPPVGLVTVIGRALGVRFVDDGTGRFEAVDPSPESAPAPQVVVVVAGTAEAMREALDRLGVPRSE